MFHTGRDCAACQPLLFPTVKIESSLGSDKPGKSEVCWNRKEYMLRFRTIFPRAIKIIKTIPEIIKTCSRSVDRKNFFLGKQSTQ